MSDFLQGTQAPQNTPAGSNTPRTTTPDNTIDPQSQMFGKVTRYAGDVLGPESEERVTIELMLLPTGTNIVELDRLSVQWVLELKGADARQARYDAGPWSDNLPVVVTFVSGTRKVEKVKTWNGRVVPKGLC